MSFVVIIIGGTGMGELFKMAQTPIPMYRGKLILIVSDDIDKINKVANSNWKLDDIYARSAIIRWQGFQGFTIILNPNNTPRKLTYGVVTHEAFHIVGAIALERGIVADWNNDESMAYLCEWIADFVFSNLKKWNIELKTI